MKQKKSPNHTLLDKEDKEFLSKKEFSKLDEKLKKEESLLEKLKKTLFSKK